MEIVKIGDGASEVLPDGERPLSNIRVQELTRVLAGPTCARMLAEYGADVMKVSAPHIPFIPCQEYDTGHGKLSTHLDLRNEAELGTLPDLACDCDIFSQGYRPESLAKRGLSPAKLAQLRPGIVFVSMCAFRSYRPVGVATWVRHRGSGGKRYRGAPRGTLPRRGQRAAILSCLSDRLPDLAFGTMVALRKRATEGGSWLVRLSLAQVGRWLQQQGEVADSKIVDVTLEFGSVDLDQWMMSSDTPMGTSDAAGARHSVL